MKDTKKGSRRVERQRRLMSDVMSMIAAGAPSFKELASYTRQHEHTLSRRVLAPLHNQGLVAGHPGRPRPAISDSRRIRLTAAGRHQFLQST